MTKKLAEMTVLELRERARSRGYKTSGLRKADLVKLLSRKPTKKKTKTFGNRGIGKTPPPIEAGDWNPVSVAGATMLYQSVSKGEARRLRKHFRARGRFDIAAAPRG